MRLMYECGMLPPPRPCLASSAIGVRGELDRKGTRHLKPDARWVDWADFPEWSQMPYGDLKDGSWPQRLVRKDERRIGSGNASVKLKPGDCAFCWKFETKETDVKTKHIDEVLLKRLKLPLEARAGVTFVDIGSGTGTLLAMLQERFPHLRAIGMARDWEQLPYTETAAARGVINLDLDITRRLPFPDSSFDVVHSMFSGLRYVTDLGRVEPVPPQQLLKLRATLLEYHRLCKPGSVIMQWPWLVSRKTPRVLTFLRVFHETAAALGWEKLALESPRAQADVQACIQDVANCMSPSNASTGKASAGAVLVYFAYRKPFGAAAAAAAP